MINLRIVFLSGGQLIMNKIKEYTIFNFVFNSILYSIS